jgi:hypothetical protein
MRVMGKSSCWQRLGSSAALPAVLLAALPLAAVLLATGCSRSPVSEGENGNSPVDSNSVSAKDHGPLPFHSEPSTDSDKAMAASDGVALPFAVSSSGTLPVGTLLTVRLGESLSEAKPNSGAPFVASLQDPIVVNGNTLVARGSLARGRLESARSSAVRGNRSYLRLTLISIQVNGQEVPLQTSSLFTRGLPSSAVQTAFSPAASVNHESGNAVRLQKGRFLTFRVSSPVSLPSVGSTHLIKSSSPSGD